MHRSKLEEWFERSLVRRPSRDDNLKDSLRKLTVIIPSYGRQDFLLRQVIYWGNHTVQVIIVDGSPKALNSDIQEIFATIPNIKYLHAFEPYAVRLSMVANHIKTPYAISISDDEFLLKKGLSDAIDKLERDSALAGCMGQSLRFHPIENGKTCTYSDGYAHWRYEIAQDNIHDRLIAGMSSHRAATCYAVLRTPVWINSWGFMQSWSSPSAIELQQAISTFISGKLSTIDEVYWLRSNENRPVTIKNEFDYKIKFDDWWSAPKFKLERENFINILTIQIVDAGQFEHSDARKMILAAMDAYIQYARQAKKISPEQSIVRHFRAFLSNMLRAILPEKHLLNLAARIFSFLNIKREGSLGTLEYLKYKDTTNSPSVNANLLSELAEIEALISGFYKAHYQTANVT